MRPTYLMIAVLSGLLPACGGSDEPVTSGNGTGQEAPDRAADAEAAIATTACENTTGMDYLCGVTNGEDILQIGSSNWLLVSGMDGSLSGTDSRGRIHLVNATGRSVEILFPGSNPEFRHDTALYGNCPGPLDIQNFSAHGLALQETEKGPDVYRLYMTSHGAREAIEVFEVEAFLKPTIKWVGCIPMPESSWTNSVAILDDGGFVATQFFNPGSHTIDNVLAGDITGHVFEWHPGDEVRVVAGTELAGPNGIAVSGNGRWVFVAAFGTAEVVRFDMNSSPPASEAIPVGILPDNIRWTPQGTLYVAGNNTEDFCGQPPCADGWSVVEITPDDLIATRVAADGGNSALHDASSALLVNDDIWVGTYSGDRLAIVPR